AMVLGSCARSLELPLHRFQGEELRVRMVATDGWNTDASTVELRSAGPGALIARRVNSTEWWADTNLGGTFRVALDGKDIGEGRVLAIDPSTVLRNVVAPAKTVRVLTVTEKNGSGQVADSRPIGGTDG